MVRGIKFVREWMGKLGQNEHRDTDLTFGQRELLVLRGYAVWADVPPVVDNPVAEKTPEPQPQRQSERKPNRREAAV